MVRWSDGCPSPWQARVIEAALQQLPRTPGLLAAWVGGSLATGLADEYSNVDLNCVVDDADLERWRSSWPSVVERCAGPLILADPIGGPVVGGYALTSRWEHVDLVVHRRSLVGHPHPCRVLYDPQGLLEDRLRPATPGAAYYPDEVVRLFLYLLGNLTVTLGRGELIVAHGGVQALCDLLAQLMLAEQGVRKSDGQKRLNPYLSAAQRLRLESVPTPAVRSADIAAACQDIAVEFTERAQRLAVLTGQPFPAKLLQATLRHLRTQLGPL